MAWFFKQRQELTPCQRLLKKIPLFAQLSRKELGMIEAILHERNYMAEEMIFDEGDVGLGMYIVVDGKVLIHRKSLMGRKEVATLGPGATFGELALLDGAPRVAAATAVEPTRLMGFFRPEFWELLESHSKLGATLCLQLARLTASRFREGPKDKPVDPLE